MAGPAAAADPQALIAKHAASTQSGAEADAAIVKRVESAIANSPMGWLQGVAGEADSKGSSEKAAADDKVGEMKDEVAANAKDAPADAGEQPKPGSPIKPSVTTPAGKDGGGDGGAPGGAGPAGKEKKAGGGKPNKGGGKGGADGSASLATAIAASGEGDINALLDAYPNRSPETLATLSKIKQMGSIADGFKGQLDIYVADGGVEGAVATAANWIGEGKNAAAVWANNPYKNANDSLGSLCKGLSAVKGVCALVGSICGKLGMILTVIGLLGMIFPPIGSAVSAVARILNIVGLICDAVAFVLSAILVGLNGVRLAKMIGNGASPEEKAAVADMMVTEANEAAGGVISLAMAFGPKFMKGFLGKSKGILSGLMRKAKAVIGNVVSKISGNVKNFVAKIFRKLPLMGPKGKFVDGIWQAEKGALSKLATKAGDGLKSMGTKIANSKAVTYAGGKLSAAGTAIKNSKIGKAAGKATDWAKDKAGKLKAWRDAKLEGDFAKKLDRFAAKTNKFGDKIDFEMKAEKLGAKIGGMGAGTKLGAKIDAWASVSEAETPKITAKIEADAKSDLIKDQAAAHNKNPDVVAAQAKGQAAIGKTGPDALAARVDGQMAGVDGNAMAAQAHKDTMAASQKAAADAASAAEAKELAEKAQKEAMNKDPKAYADEAAKARADKTKLENDPDIKTDDATRKALQAKGAALDPTDQATLDALNTKLKPLDDARAKDALIYKTLAGGAEKTAAPTMDVAGAKAAHGHYKSVQGAWDTWVHPGSETPTDRSKNWEGAETFDFKNPLKWDKGGASDGAGKRASAEAKKMGGAAPLEMPDEKKAAAADFHKFVTKKAATTSVASTVSSMFANLPKKQAPPPPPPAPVAAAPTATAATPVNKPDEVSAKPDAAPAVAPDATPAAPAATAATPDAATSGGGGGGGDSGGGAEPSADASGGADAGGGDGGEDSLPYWPKLLGESGEFGMAIKQFGSMRKVAVEFKKAQIAAKQKAVDTLAVYGKYEEYAAKRKAAAAEHKDETAQAGAAATENQTAAGAGEGAGAKGEGEQANAKSTAGQKASVDLPEPECRGFWGRIIGRIKRWAKNKAAALFGWLQEKIANVILKGLCGVSMGDLKGYSTALKNQQARAKGVADVGAAATDAASAKQDDVKSTSETETGNAEKGIAEADENMASADQFLGDINAFEQQLMSEQANAQAFIAAISAQVSEARSQQKEAAAQAASDKDAAASAPAADAAPASDEAVDAKSDDQASDQADGGTSGADQTDENEGGGDESDESLPGGVDAASDETQVDAGAPAPDAAAGVSGEPDPGVPIVQKAATYIVTAAGSATSELTSKKDDYTNQLEQALMNREKKLGSELETGATKIISGFKDHVSDVSKDLTQITAGLSEVTEQVTGAILQHAEEMDKAIAAANKALDDMFSALYDAIKASAKHSGPLNWKGKLEDTAMPLERGAEAVGDWAEGNKAYGADEHKDAPAAPPPPPPVAAAPDGPVGPAGPVDAAPMGPPPPPMLADPGADVPMVPY